MVGHRVWFVRFAHFFFFFFFSVFVWVCSDAGEGREGRERRGEKDGAKAQKQGEHEWSEEGREWYGWTPLVCWSVHVNWVHAVPS